MAALFFKSSAFKLLVVIFAQSASFIFSTANAAHSFRESAIPTHGGKVVPSSFSYWISTFRARNIPPILIGFLIAGITKAKAFGDSVIAQLAKLLWKSALATQFLAVFRHIFPFPNHRSALIAVDSVVQPLFSPAIVMTNAKSFSEMRIATNSTESFRSHSGMMFDVLRMIRKQLKIFRSVVLNISIDVVNFFWRNQQSAKGFLHYNYMFKDVSLCIRSWMVWPFDKHISTRSDISLFSSSHYHRLTDICVESTTLLIGGVRHGS